MDLDEVLCVFLLQIKIIRWCVQKLSGEASAWDIVIMELRWLLLWIDGLYSGLFYIFTGMNSILFRPSTSTLNLECCFGTEKEFNGQNNHRWEGPRL